jgi:sugar lactone lactonase YvrE
VPNAVGVLGVGIDSKGNFWAYERAINGGPSLFKFGPDHKLILTVGEDVTGHLMKAHGMAIDAQDNVWICDSNTSVVEKISPDGKLLLTLGTFGHRGDWDQARGQHLIWQPLDIAFAPNGDFFIGEGHANESPNDVDGPNADDNIGAARVLHFDKNAHFINQIYGNNVGQGRFSMAHAVAVDPKTGYVWIGDREQYRLVVYKPDGEFFKTIQMRNLTCGIGFDAQGQMWVASGMDGQVLKVDQTDGHVIGAIGNGQGKGEGQFTESNYLTWDKAGNMYTGDTLYARVTEMVKPKKASVN